MKRVEWLVAEHVLYDLVASPLELIADAFPARAGAPDRRRVMELVEKRASVKQFLHGVGLALELDEAAPIVLGTDPALSWEPSAAARVVHAHCVVVEPAVESVSSSPVPVMTCASMRLVALVP